MKNALFLLFVFTFPLFTISCTPPLEEGVSEISGADAKTLAEDKEVILIDVRTAGEVKGGMIPGALHMDVYGTDFTQSTQELDKTKPVIVYCASGIRSASAANTLAQLGFTEVYNLLGGISSWPK